LQVNKDYLPIISLNFIKKNNMMTGR